MSITRSSIIHGDLIDAIIECGYPLSDGGICAGLTMKWIEAVLLGKEAEQIFWQRLHFINAHHQKWTLYRERNHNDSAPDGYVIILEGNPEITAARFFKHKVEVKKINLDKSKKFNALAENIRKKLKKNINGLIQLENNDADKKVIHALLKDAALTYSNLIDEKNKTTQRNSQFIDVLSFFDGIALFQNPTAFVELYTGYDFLIQTALPANLSLLKNSYLYVKSTQTLYYIDAKEHLSKIDITDISTFELRLSAIQNKEHPKDKLRLSNVQLQKLIGENNDHIPSKQQLSQTDVNKLEYFSRSKIAETAGKEIQCIYSAPRVFNLSTMKNYFGTLEKLSALENDQLVLHVSSSKHRVGLKYDASTHQWTVLDANHLPLSTMSLSELTAFLMRESFDEKEFAVLSLNVYTTRNFANKKLLQSQLLETEKKYPINDTNLCHRKTKNGVSLLHLMAKNGYTDYLDLLKHLVSTDDKDDTGDSLLHYAARSSSADFFEKLLQLKPQINLNDLNASNETALILAAQLGNEKLVELLLDHHAAIHIAHSVHSPLHLAITYQHTNIAKKLLNKMTVTDLKRQDAQNNTALHIAIENNNTDIALLLINKMSADDLSLQNESSQTALHLALSKDNRKIILALIEKMSTQGFILKNEDGRTALQLAIKENNSDIASLLINKMSAQDFSYQDNNGKTALHLAIKENAQDVALALIKKMSINDLNLQDNHKQTALQLALKEYNNDIAKALIDVMNAEGLNKEDKHDDTALHLAIGRLEFDMAEKMIKKIVQTNQADNALTIQNKRGQTALHIAIKQNPTQHFTLKLIDSMDTLGLIHSNNIGVSALQYSIRKNRPAITDLLQKKLSNDALPTITDTEVLPSVSTSKHSLFGVAKEKETNSTNSIKSNRSRNLSITHNFIQ